METCSTLRGQRITTCALRVKGKLKGGAEAPVLQEAPPIKTVIIPRGQRLFLTFSPSGDNLNPDVATFPMELVIVGNSVSLRFSGPTGSFVGIAELETRFIGDIPPGSGLEGKIAALAATVPDNGSVIPDQYLPPGRIYQQGFTGVGVNATGVAIAAQPIPTTQPLPLFPDLGIPSRLLYLGINPGATNELQAVNLREFEIMWSII